MLVGGQRFDNPLVLSPMVDVTDAAFRTICRQWGAAITCSEMVSAAGLIHGNERAWNHVLPAPNESPYGVQFMTGDPREMEQAVTAVGERLSVDFVDLNLGCPAPNILRSCAGGFLLKDPRKAGKIMRAARAAADDAGIRQVSVKMRTGMDANHLTFLQIGEEAEAAGMDWMTLHGRTVAQGYAGTADWTKIAQLVDTSSIPVIGNGDLRTPDDVLRRRDETHCAGFFIARAAMHDPTVFQRMGQALRGEPISEAPGMEVRLAIAKQYLREAPAAGIDHVAALRRQVARFMAGAPGAKKLRMQLHDAAEAQTVAQIVDDALLEIARTNQSERSAEERRGVAEC